MLLNQQMTFEILLNASVKDKDVLRLSRQAEKIYSLLQRGPAKTSELASVSLQYCARLNEIRHAIAKIGFMVDVQNGLGGENQYKIVPLGVSKFWEKIKQKNEQWKWI